MCSRNLTPTNTFQPIVYACIVWSGNVLEFTKQIRTVATNYQSVHMRRASTCTYMSTCTHTSTCTCDLLEPSRVLGLEFRLEELLDVGHSLDQRDEQLVDDRADH